MRASPARHERAQWIRNGVQEHARSAGRQCHAQGVAVATGVLRGDPARLARDPYPDGPVLGLQASDPGRRGGPAHGLVVPGHAGRDLRVVQVAEAPERSCTWSADRGPRSPGQPLQLQLELGEGIAVEQLAQLLGPEQLAQQVAVEGQRLRPAVDQRRIALVHVRGDIVEQQRARERRGVGRLDADAPRSRAARRDDSSSRSAGMSKTSLEAFAVRLEDDRERAVASSPPREAAPSAAASARAASPAGAPRAAAARGPRSRGSGRRTAPRSRGPRRPPPPCRPGRRRSRHGCARRRMRRTCRRRRRPSRSARPRPRRWRGCAGRSRRPTRALARRRRATHAAAPRSRAPTERARVRRTASGRRSRQSPSSSRKRSTTIVRSVGSAPEASACSST